ncbi:uncharacterized protein B0I36DRAFT_367274 [Microdochium trichocladiopsis]|uniref:Uncharacterized protein n=1 Tax=Microdochium trichocladiopsis TaxID=1682393 RepID=A0A9P9BK22_9PEZI|nr:uncharacterized protein B0I36DRAFT_367274 [Microdochium trichocladiopsis]KAH7020789.1 hypothetical protein B0I36DRAFT_367274 [Microdochium trichocladiopsis]
MARLWQYSTYTLQSPAVDIKAAASAIAGIKPSYVCSTIRLQYNLDLTPQMISDFNTLRAAASNAKFDIELNLTPTGNRAYPNADAIVAHMKDISSKIKVDGWWLDFLSQAQAAKPHWIARAAKYAHANGQTVGGNCNTADVPPSMDAVAFVDGPDSSSPFGFSIDKSYVSAMKANVSPGTAVLGHIHCNPQARPTSEPCVFMNDWDASKRADFQNYWATQQKSIGFTYMWPIHFPLCPGNVAYDPRADKLPILAKYSSRKTVYGYMKTLAAKYN